MAKGGPSITGLNISHLFNREMLMYSFGDIKLKKPIPLKKILWTVAGFAVWSAPLFFLFGTPASIPVWILFLVPPLIFGNYVSKPVFGGKGLFEWAKAQISYIQQPRGWSDFREDNDQEDTVLFIDHEVNISRRREIAYLAKLARARADERSREAKEEKQARKSRK